MASTHRLPRHVHPSKYDVRIATSSDGFEFHGFVSVSLDITAWVEAIEMHVKHLAISSAELQQEEASLPLAVEFAPADEIVRFTTGALIEPGEATLNVRFHGKLNATMREIHRVFGDDVGCATFSLRDIADAREAFPCFDEDAFDAPVSSTLQAGIDPRTRPDDGDDAM